MQAVRSSRQMPIRSYAYRKALHRNDRNLNMINRQIVPELDS